MKDVGHEETDAILEALEKRIAREYKTAEKEVREKLDDYLRRFEKKDQRWREWVADGTKTEAEYKQWKIGQLAIGRRWEIMRETIAEDYHNANVIARAITDNQMLDVYALNHNYATYEVETGAQVDTSYTLYNRDTVKRIMDEGKELYHAPGKKLSREIAKNKDIRWNKQQVQSVMMQSILQGEAIPKIATRLANTVGESNRNVAIRNARTMTTGVENAGRQDSYKRAQDLGIEMEKQWIATLDGRTRHSHRFLDGEIVAVNDVFSNGCEFPGDPEGDPAEIYNCRCTMISQVKGFETDVSDLSLRHDANLEGMTYEEWKNEHESKSNPLTLPEEKGEAIRQAYLARYRKGVFAKGKQTDNKEEVESSIKYDFRGKDEKYKVIKELIDKLASQYNTRLENVIIGGAEKAAGDVDITGNRIRINTVRKDVVIHEFAHTLANSDADKYGLTHDTDFWKEIKSVRRQYRKETQRDMSQWISIYEHDNKKVDEFMAEAFTQAKLNEMGLEIPQNYKGGMEWSNKVLKIIDKYFKKG